MKKNLNNIICIILMIIMTISVIYVIKYCVDIYNSKKEKKILDEMAVNEITASKVERTEENGNDISKEKIDNIGVVINGKLYREEKYSCIIDRNELLTYIKVYIKLDDGLYNLKIINRADGKKINGCEFDFIIDKNFEYKLNLIPQILKLLYHSFFAYQFY